MAIVLRLKDLNQDKAIADLQSNKVDLTTYNAGMNDVNTKIQQLQTDLQNGIADAKAYADSLVASLKDNEIKELQDAIALLNADANTEGSVDWKISQAISNLIDGAPDALDTLKEIVDYIQQNDVDLENLINSVKEQVTALVDNASADYNTLGKIEARIKEVVAAHAADVQAINASIDTVSKSIPVYAFEKDIAVDTDNYTITLSKVPYGDIMNGIATLYYVDAAGNIVEFMDVTVSKNADDTTGKVYNLEIPDEAKTAFANELSQAKAMVSYFWREIDNQ